VSDKGKPFLRVVASRESSEVPTKLGSKPKRRRSIQLGLPYERAHTVVFVDAMRASSEQFYELLGLLKPQWIIDARSMPRFDILLGSRQYAFSTFAELSATYVDLFGELQISTTRVADVNPRLWSGKLSERIKRAQSSDGPYLFIFDDSSLMDAAKWEVPQMMKTILRKPIGAAADGLQLIA